MVKTGAALPHGRMCFLQISDKAVVPDNIILYCGFNSTKKLKVRKNNK